MKTDTLLISRSQVKSLLSIPECIEAVENIMRMRAVGEIGAPGILGIHAKDGGFHIKAGIGNLNANYFVSKINANFPKNKSAFNLPSIQGVIVVSDADNGRLLALIDSIEPTIIRTGAATAVAAKFLSQKDANAALICGCGNQGRISIECLAEVRNLKKIYVYDIDQNTAKKLSDEFTGRETFEVIPVKSIQEQSKNCQIIVTCTPSKEYFLTRNDISEGTFIAAVGSDNEDKNELDPALLVSSKLVTDSTEQCATIGELHHAIKKGLLNKSNVHAELGEVAAGLKPGRTSESETIIFDSTGTALQDIAASAIIYEKARHSETTFMNFAE